ncbi:MAG: Acyltransferase 3 [Pedosphaera sp.]|nr:Acyltransferase 3 [Pedosphaera sp.]
MNAVTNVQPVRSEFRLGHNRALDGLRGVAVAVVVVSHADIIRRVFGAIAVDVFFVLSGFLITCLLVKEWDKTNSISFKNFYIRRALRLLPALIVLLVVFISYKYVTAPAPQAVACAYEALRALFYVTNWSIVYYYGHTDYLGHTWSLSVEEQFYLLWPVILLVLLPRISRSALFCWLALGAFLSCLGRTLLYIGANASAYRLLYSTDTRADALLLGCMLGLGLTSDLLPKDTRGTGILNYVSLVSAAGLVSLGFLPEFPMYYLGWGLTSVFAVMIIMDLVTTRQGVLRSILELPFLGYLGRISYGLYLWHNPIFRAIQDQHWPWWINAAVGIPVTTGATLASYYLVEKPCLRLKKRFQTAATPADGLARQPVAEVEA